MIDSMCYVVYRHKKLDDIRKFLLDFGMLIVSESDERIYLRGYGDAPFIYVAERGDENKFVGPAFKADSLESLQALSRRFEADIRPSSRPGGGQYISILDPDGKTVEIVYGAETVAPIATRAPVDWNSGGQRNRFGRFPIFPSEPAPVLNLQHTVMSSPQPQRMIDWLVKEFGAYPSDAITKDDGGPVLVFLRFPRGKTYVPHHHVAVSLGSEPGAQHTCFETIDLDAIFMGSRYLKKQGHEAGWGPLRHSLGGAISDYWLDPSGFFLEHVTDGDLVNDECATAYWSINDEVSRLQWETNPMPANFIK